MPSMPKTAKIKTPKAPKKGSKPKRSARETPGSETWDRASATSDIRRETTKIPKSPAARAIINPTSVKVVESLITVDRDGRDDLLLPRVHADKRPPRNRRGRAAVRLSTPSPERRCTAGADLYKAPDQRSG